MFYCDDCAKKYGYPESICKSVGLCELCNEDKICNDRPCSTSLPLPKDFHPQSLGMDESPFPKRETEIKTVNPFTMMEDRNLEIEKIAWQVFLSRTGLTFRRELTADEKKQITEVDMYEFYRAEALKIYEKRQRGLLNKKYPVIEIPADGKSGRSGGAYCLCFVYSKYKGNFVLKGYMREVEEYLKKNYTHYFCNFSLWHSGQNRDIWHFWKKEIGIFDVSIKERRKGKKTEVRPWREYELDEAVLEAKTMKFRRLPKRWIPEFDNL